MVQSDKSNQDADRRGGRPSERGASRSALVGLLGIVAMAVFAVAALLVATDDRPVVPGFEPVDEKLLFPELAGRLGDVTVVEIAGAGGPVTLKRESGTWRLQERDGYPVDAAAVEEMLTELAGMKVVYASTDTPGPLSDFDLSARVETVGLTTSETAPVRVELRDAGSEPIAGVVVGSSQSAPGGPSLSKVMVRRTGDQRTWLADGKLRVDSDPMAWVDDSLAHVPRQEVVRVEVVRGDGDEIVIARESPEESFELERGSLPSDAGGERRTLLSGIAGALEYLSFEDVRAAGSIADGQPADPRRVRFETASGLVISVTTTRRDDALWARFSASTVDGGATADAGSAAERLNERRGEWAYRIPETFADAVLAKPSTMPDPERNSNARR